MSFNATMLRAVVVPLALIGCQSGTRDVERGAPAGYPIRYSIGSVDPRFGMDRERFLTLVRRAEQTWEEPLGLSLFEYDPTSEFTVNLVFDHRQERTLEARKARTGLDEQNRSIQSLLDEYNSVSHQHSSLKSGYESRLGSFTTRLDAYNRRVAEWNNKGGAPPDEYERLNAEKAAIEAQRGEVDRSMRDVNAAADRLNTLAATINGLADRYNIEVALFNGRFVESREFEQGQYDGQRIAVYQFHEESDLTVALIHEFGHALGFEHVDTPESIMNRRLERQDLQNIRLTEPDLLLLRGKFHR